MCITAELYATVVKSDSARRVSEKYYKLSMGAAVITTGST